MEAAPFEEPERSVEEGLLLREAIADAVEALPPRQQWIFEARHYRGMSIRQIAAELNLAKSYVDRLLKQAIATLAQDPILNSAVGSAGLDGRNETKGP